MSKHSPTKRPLGSSQEAMYGSVPDMTSAGSHLRTETSDSETGNPEPPVDQMSGAPLTQNLTETTSEVQADTHTFGIHGVVDKMATATVEGGDDDGELVKTTEGVSDNVTVSEYAVQAGESQGKEELASVDSAFNELGVKESKSEYDTADEDDDDDEPLGDDEQPSFIPDSIRTSTPIKNKEQKPVELSPNISDIQTPKPEDKSSFDDGKFNTVCQTVSEPVKYVSDTVEENIDKQKQTHSAPASVISVIPKQPMSVVESETSAKPKQPYSSPVIPTNAGAESSFQPKQIHSAPLSVINTSKKTSQLPIKKKSTPFPLGTKDSMSGVATVKPSDILKRKQKVKTEIKLTSEKVKSPLAAETSSGRLPMSPLAAETSMGRIPNSPLSTESDNKMSDQVKLSDQKPDEDMPSSIQKAEPDKKDELYTCIDNRNLNYGEDGKKPAQKITTKESTENVDDEEDDACDVFSSTMSFLPVDSLESDQGLDKSICNTESKNVASSEMNKANILASTESFLPFVSIDSDQELDKLKTKESVCDAEDQKVTPSGMTQSKVLASTESFLPFVSLDSDQELDKLRAGESVCDTEGKDITPSEKTQSKVLASIESFLPFVSLDSDQELDKLKAGESLYDTEGKNIPPYGMTQSNLQLLFTFLQKQRQSSETDSIEGASTASLKSYELTPGGSDTSRSIVEGKQSEEADEEFEGRVIELDYCTPSKLMMQREKLDGNQEMGSASQLDSQQTGNGNQPENLSIYSTPSKLLQERLDREKEEYSSKELPDYTPPSRLVVMKTDEKKDLEYTTPSVLLERTMDRESKEKDLQYTTPSRLLQKSEDREKAEMMDSRLQCTTPSRLLQKTEDREKTEMMDSRFQYTTPSRLLQKSDDREKAEMMDPGLQYTTPSRLLQKTEDREKTELFESRLQYTPPSQLLHKTEDREKREILENRLHYTPPSQLLQKIQDREKKVLENKLQYTTPSRLLQKTEDREKKENLESRLQYTTPSHLLQKTEDREKKENLESRLHYTTPSRLLQKTEDREKKENLESRLQYTTPSHLLQKTKDREKKENLESRLHYTTPSRLLQKTEDREKKENLESRLHYTTPSHLLQKTDDREKKENLESRLYYTTPSRLLQKTEDREKKENLESRLQYTTPSGLLQKTEDREKKENLEYRMQYTTPSRLLQKSENREKVELAQDKLQYITPSQLLQKSEDREKADVCRDKLQYTTPSRLLQKTEDREKVEALQDKLQYTTPSKLLQKSEEREKREILKNKLQYTTPSQLIQKSEDREKEETAQDKLQYTTPSCLLVKTEDREKMETVKDQIDSDESGHDDNSVTKEIERVTSKKDSDWWSTQSDVCMYFMSLSDILRNTAMHMKAYSDPTVYFTRSNQFDSVSSFHGKDVLRDPSSFSSWKESDCDLDSVNKRKKKGTKGTVRSTNTAEDKLKSCLELKGSSLSFTANPSFIEIPSSSDEETESSKEQEKDLEISEKRTRSVATFAAEPDSCDELLETLASLNELFWSLYSCNPELTNSVMSSSDLSNLSLDLLTCMSQHSYSTALDVASSQHAAQLPASDILPVNDRDEVSKNTGLTEQPETMRTRTQSSDRSPRLNSSLSPRVSYRGRSDIGAQKKRMLPHTSGSRSITPDARSFMMEKEVMESQNRKLQMEISTLQTENKLLKEKYNRATVRVNEVEDQLAATQEELESLQDSLSQELSQVERKNKSEVAKDMDQLQSRVISLTRENESLKAEVSSLEKQLESAHKMTGLSRQNAEKSKTMEAFKIEVTALKDEVTKLKSLLDQSERHLQEEELRSRESSQQVIKLTEMKNLLQQQLEGGVGGGTFSEKQVKSLEKRLKITEERLHQERADRANNLSQVEDKLLTENARLQAAEKELNRQLQREKDKNRNLENKIRDVKDENEKMRLALPFDESSLTTQKGSYDIPYSVHTSQRVESVKLLDYKHILAQIEREYGLKAGQEQDIICQLWDTRDKSFKQLRQLEVLIQQLNLRDNNIAEGLKNLRDLKGQFETKTKQLEEKLENSISEKATLETTYKEQLSTLVTERHDAFARLKTLEDLMEATKKENEILRNVSSVPITAEMSQTTHAANVEGLNTEIRNLESKNTQLLRSGKMMEGELSTLKAQLEARNKALEDTQNDLDLAYNRLASDESSDWKQQKIDKLSSQVNGLQTEIKLITDKYNVITVEKNKLENELQTLRHDITVSKSRHKDKFSDAPDSKVVHAWKEDLDERSRRITKLNEAYNEMESHFQQAKQELYMEQARSNDLDAQVESLEQQLQYRSQILDTLTGTEKEQLAQFQILKETLDTVSQELNQKQAQMKLKQAELSKEKDKTDYLNTQLQDERRGKPEGEKSLVGVELQLRELQNEREQLKTELIEAHTDLTKAAEDFAAIENEVKKLNQELVTEKATQLQLASEKGELEQHLEEIAEEHDALVQEKTQAEEDMVKLENKLQEILQTFEIEAQHQHNNFSSRYQNIPPEARELVSEVESLRTLLEAKAKEHEVLTDKLSRQQREIEFFQRRVELLHNENQSNRDDIARMTNELATKMKDSVSTREVNQFLVSERAKLQSEKAQIEREFDKEKTYNERRKSDIEDVIRKVEQSENSYKSSVKEVSQKDLMIVNLEGDIKDAQRSIQHLENDNTQLKNKIERMNEDMKNLTAVKESLEKMIEMEKNQTTEEKMVSSQRKDELSSINHKYEMLRQEQTIMLNKLNAEKQAVESLKERLQSREEENDKLMQEVHTSTIELESTRSQLYVSQENLKDLKHDKDKLYNEHDSLCRSITEKEKKISELEEKCEATIQNLQREIAFQRHNMEKDKTSSERELESAKEEINALNEEIKQKESQLSTFGKTLKELEDVTREKSELELHLKQIEASHGDSQVLLESHRKEIMSLQSTLSRQQETLSKLEMEKTIANEKLREHKENSERQLQDLNSSLSQVKNQNEGERIFLKDNITQMQSRVESLESSLSSAIQARDKLQVSSRMTERSLDETKEQLQGETTGRKIAEQRAEALQTQLNEARKDRFLTEEKLSDARTKLNKLEKDHKSDKDKLKRLSDQYQELEATSYNYETSSKSKTEQVDILQDELNKLKQILETQKQQLNGKLKKTSLEYKQQVETLEQERSKLTQQNQQLAQDLEHTREQVAAKNKDNLKLQEEIMSLEDQNRENSSKLRQAEDTLKAEEHLQTQLSSRFYAQEEELKQLKSFFARKVEESGDADKSMWQEMSQLIQNMSRQMQQHIQSQSITDKEKKEMEAKQLNKCKKQLNEVESELNTEKALHQITKSSLQALEEDNKRLRHQLHTLRKRDTSGGDKKQKSRMEAINEIIARSQSQAQAMLAAGGYFDDTLRSIGSPRYDYHASPDNSLAEDFSFSSTAPAMYQPSSPPSKVRKGQAGSPGRKSSP